MLITCYYIIEKHKTTRFQLFPIANSYNIVLIKYYL